MLHAPQAKGRYGPQSAPTHEGMILGFVFPAPLFFIFARRFFFSVFILWGRGPILHIFILIFYILPSMVKCESILPCARCVPLNSSPDFFHAELFNRQEAAQASKFDGVRDFPKRKVVADNGRKPIGRRHLQPINRDGCGNGRGKFPQKAAMQRRCRVKKMPAGGG